MARSRYQGSRAARLRRRQLQIIALIATQAGAAAALAWWLSANVLGNPNPVFAPTAAVGTIAAAIGQRTRRTLELLIGVALGIVIGDILIYLVGAGTWQTGFIVGAAIFIALVFAGRGGTVVSHVGGTAVLIATLSSSQRDLELPRIVDASVGSLVGMVVVALLLPLNPHWILNRAAEPVFELFVGQLRNLASALAKGDPDRARAVQDRLRAMGPDRERLREALSGAEEVVRISPARWHRRQEYERYAVGVKHMNRMIDTCTDLARRSATLLEYGEPVPRELSAAVGELADAVEQLRRESRRQRPHGETRKGALAAASTAGRARQHPLRPFGEAVLTQIRAAASDLVRATGVRPAEANRLVRREVLRAVHADRSPDVDPSQDDDVSSPDEGSYQDDDSSPGSTREDDSYRDPAEESDSPPGSARGG
ncbi:FUSC family protein [Micromonospora sp. WMMD882]|uniref:FUSC family protein n=1 Tax=Micromonospora sp. WMMD882 TaxID=3015151 RepID=UPI00248BB005|nr:FUSC family protein [Micromonospora sp. WMMD882]WBB77822.1 FUSC family protein [Micromonospora sp. WMMD882]